MFGTSPEVLTVTRRREMPKARSDINSSIAGTNVAIVGQRLAHSHEHDIGHGEIGIVVVRRGSI